MQYYKVKHQFTYWTACKGYEASKYAPVEIRHQFVKDELCTAKELQKITRRPFDQIEAGFLERFKPMNISPRKICFNFGARFEAE